MSSIDYTKLNGNGIYVFFTVSLEGDSSINIAKYYKYNDDDFSNAYELVRLDGNVEKIAKQTVQIISNGILDGSSNILGIAKKDDDNNYEIKKGIVKNIEYHFQKKTTLLNFYNHGIYDWVIFDKIKFFIDNERDKKIEKLSSSRSDSGTEQLTDSEFDSRIEKLEKIINGGKIPEGEISEGENIWLLQEIQTLKTDFAKIKDNGFDEQKLIELINKELVKLGINEGLKASITKIVKETVGTEQNTIQDSSQQSTGNNLNESSKNAIIQEVLGEIKNQYQEKIDIDGLESNLKSAFLELTKYNLDKSTIESRLSELEQSIKTKCQECLDDATQAATGAINEAKEQVINEAKQAATGAINDAKEQVINEAKQAAGGAIADAKIATDGAIAGAKEQADRAEKAAKSAKEFKEAIDKISNTSKTNSDSKLDTEALKSAAQEAVNALADSRITAAEQAANEAKAAAEKAVVDAKAASEKATEIDKLKTDVAEAKKVADKLNDYALKKDCADKSSLEKMTQRLDKLNKSSEELVESKLTSVKNQFDTLFESDSKKTQAIEEMTKKIGNVPDDIGTYQQKIEENKKEIDKFAQFITDNNLGGFDSNISVLNSKNEALQKEIDNLREQFETLKKPNSSADHMELSQINLQISNLEKQLKDREKIQESVLNKNEKLIEGLQDQLAEEAGKEEAARKAREEADARKVREEADAREKEAKEKAAREKAEREAKEKAEREKAPREESVAQQLANTNANAITKDSTTKSINYFDNSSQDSDNKTTNRSYELQNVPNTMRMVELPVPSIKEDHNEKLNLVNVQVDPKLNNIVGETVSTNQTDNYANALRGGYNTDKMIKYEVPQMYSTAGSGVSNREYASYYNGKATNNDINKIKYSIVCTNMKILYYYNKYNISELLTIPFNYPVWNYTALNDEIKNYLFVLIDKSTQKMSEDEVGINWENIKKYTFARKFREKTKKSESESDTDTDKYEYITDIPHILKLANYILMKQSIDSFIDSYVMNLVFQIHDNIFVEEKNDFKKLKDLYSLVLSSRTDQTPIKYEGDKLKHEYIMKLIELIKEKNQHYTTDKNSFSENSISSYLSVLNFSIKYANPRYAIQYNNDNDTFTKMDITYYDHLNPIPSDWDMNSEYTAKGYTKSKFSYGYFTKGFKYDQTNQNKESAFDTQKNYFKDNITKSLKNKNVYIFGYGSSGSGKTSTLIYNNQHIFSNASHGSGIGLFPNYVNAHLVVKDNQEVKVEIFEYYEHKEDNLSQTNYEKTNGNKMEFIFTKNKGNNVLVLKNEYHDKNTNIQYPSFENLDNEIAYHTDKPYDGDPSGGFHEPKYNFFTISDGNTFNNKIINYYGFQQFPNNLFQDDFIHFICPKAADYTEMEKFNNKHDTNNKFSKLGKKYDDYFNEMNEIIDSSNTQRKKITVYTTEYCQGKKFVFDILHNTNLNREEGNTDNLELDRYGSAACFIYKSNQLDDVGTDTWNSINEKFTPLPNSANKSAITNPNNDQLEYLNELKKMKKKADEIKAKNRSLHDQILTQIIDDLSKKYEQFLKYSRYTLQYIKDKRKYYDTNRTNKYGPYEKFEIIELLKNIIDGDYTILGNSNVRGPFHFIKKIWKHDFRRDYYIQNQLRLFRSWIFAKMDTHKVKTGTPTLFHNVMYMKYFCMIYLNYGIGEDNYKRGFKAYTFYPYMNYDYNSSNEQINMYLADFFLLYAFNFQLNNEVFSSGNNSMIRRFKFYNNYNDIGTIMWHTVDVDRNINSTMNNPDSSRSHVIYKITRTETDTSYNDTSYNNLYVGDFAGIENEFQSTNMNTLISFIKNDYEKMTIPFDLPKNKKTINLHYGKLLNLMKDEKFINYMKKRNDDYYNITPDALTNYIENKWKEDHLKAILQDGTELKSSLMDDKNFKKLFFGQKWGKGKHYYTTKSVFGETLMDSVLQEDAGWPIDKYARTYNPKLKNPIRVKSPPDGKNITTKIQYNKAYNYIRPASENGFGIYYQDANEFKEGNKLSDYPLFATIILKVSMGLDDYINLERMIENNDIMSIIMNEKIIIKWKEIDNKQPELLQKLKTLRTMVVDNTFTKPKKGKKTQGGTRRIIEGKSKENKKVKRFTRRSIEKKSKSSKVYRGGHPELDVKSSAAPLSERPIANRATKIVSQPVIKGKSNRIDNSGSNTKTKADAEVKNDTRKQEDYNTKMSLIMYKYLKNTLILLHNTIEYVDDRKTEGNFINSSLIKLVEDVKMITYYQNPASKYPNYKLLGDDSTNGTYNHTDTRTQCFPTNMCFSNNDVEKTEHTIGSELVKCIFNDKNDQQTIDILDVEENKNKEFLKLHIGVYGVFNISSDRHNPPSDPYINISSLQKIFNNEYDFMIFQENSKISNKSIKTKIRKEFANLINRILVMRFGVSDDSIVMNSDIWSKTTITDILEYNNMNEINQFIGNLKIEKIKNVVDRIHENNKLTPIGTLDEIYSYIIQKTRQHNIELQA